MPTALFPRNVNLDKLSHLYGFPVEIPGLVPEVECLYLACAFSVAGVHRLCFLASGRGAVAELPGWLEDLSHAVASSERIRHRQRRLLPEVRRFKSVRLGGDTYPSAMECATILGRCVIDVSRERVGPWRQLRRRLSARRAVLAAWGKGQ
jgi:hypothetical protein